MEKERQYRQTPGYQAYAKAYRSNPENKTRHAELNRGYANKTMKNTEDHGHRRNVNEAVRSKVVKKIAEYFKLDEDEVNRILSVRKYAALTEPELVVRHGYQTEYAREYARHIYKEKREAISRRRKELYHEKKDLNQSIDTLLDSGFFDDADKPDADEHMREDDGNLDTEDINFDVFDVDSTRRQGGKKRKKTKKRKKSYRKNKK